MAKNKVYAYLVDGQEGIVDTWAECEVLVSGRGGARYKGFARRIEAEAWLKTGAYWPRTSPSKAPRLPPEEQARQDRVDNARAFKIQDKVEARKVEAAHKRASE